MHTKIRVTEKGHLDEDCTASTKMHFYVPFSLKRKKKNNRTLEVNARLHCASNLHAGWNFLNANVNLHATYKFEFICKYKVIPAHLETFC